MRSIGIVGTGPSAIYSLKHLLGSRRRLTITMFERGSRAGVGTPYDPEKNDAAMLANIASIELPPVTETLVDWLHSRSDADLAALHISRAEIDDRAFYPRVLIGAYYADQLAKLIEQARKLGHSVEALTNHNVVDVIVHSDDAVVEVEKDGETLRPSFDYVIVASGHQDREATDEEGGRVGHAYNQGEVEKWRDARIGVLGTSLSAIDVAIGAASEAGQFRRQGEGLKYEAFDTESRFVITLMSRRGLLPEADFYCPIPYQPLEIFTKEAIDAICQDGNEDKLDRIFDLFKEKLAIADPGYADGIGLAFLTPDDFAEVYFSARQRVPALDWARANLAEAKANKIARKTVAWRYAILRMHELFGNAVKHFSKRDQERFSKGLKNVFIDNYAAVPPLSIERLLALADAGHLTIEKLGADYELTNQASGQSLITVEGKTTTFDYMVDARGQPALTLQELPFPTLRLQIIVNERAAAPRSGGRVEADILEDSVDVGDAFELNDGLYNLSRVYCLSIPHLLKLHPFIQGLTSCNDLAIAMAQSLEAEMMAEGPQPDDLSALDKVRHFDEHSLIFNLGLARAA